MNNRVAFFSSIRFRLLMAVLVPVVCIIILGVVCYNKASDAIVNSYEESTSQTVDMMAQYIELVITSEENNFLTYLSDSDFEHYIAGYFISDEATAYAKSMKSTLFSSIGNDSKLEDIIFLANGDRSFDANASMSGDLYNAYISTTQGAIVAEGYKNWYVFGVDEEADAAVGISSDGYALRIAHNINSTKGVMLLDVDADYIRSAMESLDPGEGGYLALITSDGAEFYSDSELSFDEDFIYGTDLYTAALAATETTSSTVTINGTSYLAVYSLLPDPTATVVVGLIPSVIIMDEADDIKQITIIITTIAVIIALALGLIISGQMTRTIRYIITQLNKVSTGDFTVTLQSKGKDELGLLCKGINNTVSQVKGLIVHVHDVSSQVNSSSEIVTEAAGTFLQTINEIQDVVSKIEVGSSKLDYGSENCLVQMDTLSGKISNVSLNADEIGRLTSSTGETINAGISTVQSLTESAQSTTEITANVISSIEELAEKSKSINNIIGAINEIAEQTNLLSLNASIEAARAGEAGRGFSVVAEEIRKLSDQCLDSANQISAIVQEIINQTKDVSSIAQQAQAVVLTQAGAVETTTHSFRQIDSQVESLLGVLNTIVANVSEMNSARANTLEAIEDISTVSAETATCSDLMNHTANTQMSAADGLSQASKDLELKAQSLMDALSSFTIA